MSLAKRNDINLKLISLLKFVENPKISLLDLFFSLRLNNFSLFKDNWGRKVVWGYLGKAGLQPEESFQGLKLILCWLTSGLVATCTCHFLVVEGTVTGEGSI